MKENGLLAVIKVKKKYNKNRRDTSKAYCT